MLSKLDSPRKRQLLGGRVEQRARLEGLIDPDEQIANQQLLDQSVILVNGVRIALDLQLVE